MESEISNNNPRELLSPEAVPVLHSIMQRVQATDSEDLPSTVDIEALKVSF